MCLSTVYKGVRQPDTLIMKNVMSISCTEDAVVLTDLMENTVSVPGKLKEANLVEGFVIIEE